MNLQHIGDGIYTVDAYLMRTNSAIGDRSWVAQVSGLDPKYGFSRRFVDREKFQSGWNSDGRQAFGPLEPGMIYEYRNIAEENQSGYSYNRHGGLSGFFSIVDGQMRKMTKVEVTFAMRKTECTTDKAATGSA